MTATGINGLMFKSSLLVYRLELGVIGVLFAVLSFYLYFLFRNFLLQARTEKALGGKLNATVFTAFAAKVSSLYMCMIRIIMTQIQVYSYTAIRILYVGDILRNI